MEGARGVERFVRVGCEVSRDLGPREEVETAGVRDWGALDDEGG